MESFAQAKKRRKREMYWIRKHRAANPNCLLCENAYEVTGIYNTVHHLKPIREGGTHKDGLATLCDECHRAIHTVDDHFSYSHVNPELTQFCLFAITIA